MKREISGGAFVIPYIIVLFLVGRPIYYLEMVVGQFSSRSSINVFDLCPLTRGTYTYSALTDIFDFQQKIGKTINRNRIRPDDSYSVRHIVLCINRFSDYSILRLIFLSNFTLESLQRRMGSYVLRFSDTS